MGLSLFNFNKQIIFTSIALLYSCSTTQKSAPKEPKNAKKQAATQVQKKKESTAVAVSQAASKMQAASSSTDDLVLWLNRISTPENVFTIKDRQYVISLPPVPKPGSLAEAAIVTGTLRDVITPPGGQTQFSNVDASLSGGKDEKAIIPMPRQTGSELNAIERRLSEKGIDLPTALKSNNLLKTAAIFQWSWNASLLEGNSETFRTRLGDVIQSEAILWKEIIAKTSPATTQPFVETNLPNDTAVKTQEPGTSMTPSSNLPLAAEGGAVGTMIPVPNPSGTNSKSVDGLPLKSNGPARPEDIASSNAAMARAQEAASKENYEKAVEESSKVKDSTPQFAIAQENIRQWSNRAVTDLRKKAAFEYRTASTITDAKAKKVSLLKAKGYLEDALKKYPQASNLDTVKDNLRIIESEIQ